MCSRFTDHGEKLELLSTWEVLAWEWLVGINRGKQRNEQKREGKIDWKREGNRNISKRQIERRGERERGREDKIIGILRHGEGEGEKKVSNWT